MFCKSVLNSILIIENKIKTRFPNYVNIKTSVDSVPGTETGTELERH